MDGYKALLATDAFAFQGEISEGERMKGGIAELWHHPAQHRAWLWKMELFGDFLLHPPTRLQILTGENISENFFCSGFGLDERPAKQKSLKNLIKSLLNLDSSSF